MTRTGLTGILLVHGWGFGPGVWRPMLRLLPAQWPHLTVRRLDLGFYGTPDTTLPTSGRWLVVGHSLGFLWLLHQLRTRPEWARTPSETHPVAALMSINSFARFAAGHDFPEGVPPTVLRSMSRQLSRAPEEVIRTFLKQAARTFPALHSWPVLPERMDPAVMGDGLAWLTQWDERATLATWADQTSILASRDDAIAPPALLLASLGEAAATIELHWSDHGDGGGHLLPLTRPDWCCAHIRRVLERSG
jgi:pimeloyl-[acyl-carrier protein] methyl ester esterase